MKSYQFLRIDSIRNVIDSQKWMPSIKTYAKKKNFYNSPVLNENFSEFVLHTTAYFGRL